MTERNKGGRPQKYPGEGRRPVLSLRVRGGMYEKLQAASEASERSMSEEMERRLDASFAESQAPSFEDVRLMIREEIRAALREERNFAPHPDLLKATHAHVGVPTGVSGYNKACSEIERRTGLPTCSWKV